MVPTQPAAPPGLIRPTLAICAAALLAMLALALFLAGSFDHTARLREEAQVSAGLAARQAEAAAAVAPLVSGAQARAHLAGRPDPAWPDPAWPDPAWFAGDLAPRLLSSAGVTRAYLLTSKGTPLIAAVDARPADPQTYQPFAPGVAALLPALHRRAAADPHPTQANGLLRAEGRAWMVTASMVEPAAAGPASPIVVTAVPVDHPLLARIGDLYQIGDLVERGAGESHVARAAITVADPLGAPALRLAWTAPAPGSAALLRLLLLAPFALILLGFVASRVLARSLADAEPATPRQDPHRDLLTGLPNRALFFERLHRTLARLRREQIAVAVHCLDIDHLAAINKTLGRAAGDELLRQVAKRLAGRCRETDTIARLHGDRFALLQPDATAAGASHLAERLCAAFTEPFDLAAGTVEVSASIGVTLVAEAGTEPGEALGQAELALYGAKSGGRGRFAFFEPDMDAAQRLRRGLEADLATALAADALAMVYQPQVDTRGQVVAIEALLRWTHPERGAIPPAVFVPLAEESALIDALSAFTFRRTFAQTADWAGMPVSINVSARELAAPGFVDTVLRFAQAAGVEPRRYAIEITETALQHDDEAIALHVAALKQAGFAITLDDFGSDWASLALLRRLPIDTIKIGRSLVHRLSVDAESHAMAEAILRLGRALQLEVVGAGVETEAQRAALIAQGCTRFQGYLTGRPMPAAQIEQVAALPNSRRTRNAGDAMVTITG